MSPTEHPETPIDSWGIQRQWVDAAGQPRTIPDETVRSLRAAIGWAPEDLADTAPVVTRPGRELGLGGVQVVCEDGTTRLVDGALPEDFPLGYHWLSAGSGPQRRLIVSPGRCWLPDSRAWGWTTQLYAARSRRSWGIGDLADLRTIRTWSQSLGAGFMLVNPLHAVAPTRQQEASPYLPVTRRFRNPIYLAVEETPGADRVDLSELAEAGRALGQNALIERDRVWQLKIAALEKIWATGVLDEEFADWTAAQGESLQEFAVWSAVAERYGGHWPDWDPALHDPHGPGVAAFVRANTDRVRFHVWLQWLLDRQLRAATDGMNVIQDLPIGVSGGGADAWVWQDTIADGVRVGAPPDLFSAKGQDWGSPPLIPWRLRARNYEPFIESVRATMAGSGGVRIDHVMGLFRLWWVPEGASDPRGGGYVRYPSEEMLDIVALESHRARAVVVGEDLGVVEPGVRETLVEHNILSYKLLWFEQEDPVRWPETSLAAVTTHDLPTVAGVWSGSDLVEQASGADVPEDDLVRGREDMVERIRQGTGLDANAPEAEAVRAAHRLLAGARSILASATLEDAVAGQRRPNIPGAKDRENWCLALPVLLEDLPDDPVALAVVRELRNRV